MTLPQGLVDAIDAMSDLEESPETRGAGDGSSGDDETPTHYGRPPEGEPVVDNTAPIPGGGALLAERDPARLFRTIDKAVERQDRLARNRHEEGTHWERVKRGTPFARLHKSEDRATIRAVLPPGVDDTTGVPNKVLDVSKRIIAQVVVDPFLPNPRAEGETDKTRGAVDLATKYLRADGGPTGTDDAALWREVLALNMVRKSAYVMVWIDPHGNGWRPKQIMAHPQAVDPAQPFTDPDGNYATQNAILRYVGEVEGEPDPLTGEPTTVEQFVEDPAAAARQWMPKHRRKVIHPNQVRTIPAAAEVKDADQIVVLMWEPLCEARKRFPVLATLEPERLKRVTAWRPPHWQRIVPLAMRRAHEAAMQTAEPHDDSLVFWYHLYCPIGPDYPDGAEIAVNGAGSGAQGSRGDGFVLLRDTLREDVRLDDGTTVPVLIDPGLIQFKALPDTEDGDPQGHAMIADWAGSKELLDILYTALIDITDRGLNPNVYLPATSPITREEFNRRDGTPLEVLSKDDLPMYEPQPDFPDWAPQVLDMVQRDLDSAAGMSETAKGLDSKYAVSGTAKQVSISQAKVALAQYWQGLVAGICHYWTVKLQQAQARLTVPQLVKLAGENTSHKQRWFVGHDLIGVTDVLLAPGSGTMMTGQEKAQWLSWLQQNQWLSPEQAGELARSSMSDDLGLPPSPHEDRIDRALAEWADGPPEGWMEAYQAYQTWQQQVLVAEQQTQTKAQEMMQFGVDGQRAMNAASVMFQVPPAPPPFYNPFSPRPNDEEPLVAREHHRKLTRFMATVEYTKWDGPWRQLFDERYAQAAWAAGIVTVRQQYEMQAQEQATALAQGQAAGAQQGAEQERDRQHQTQEAARDRQAQAQSDTLAAATQVATAAAQPGGPPR